VFKVAMAIRVSLVVPLFNEEKGISMLVNRVRRLHEKLQPRYELECLLVDDGSRDATVAVLHERFSGFSWVRILEHGNNRGAGAAMRTGFRKASGDILCTMDADCTFDPLEIPRLLEAMERERADIGIGSPYHPEGR